MSNLDRIRRSFELGSPFAQGSALYEIEQASSRIAALEAENDRLRGVKADLVADLKKIVDHLIYGMDKAPSNLTRKAEMVKAEAIAADAIARAEAKP